MSVFIWQIPGVPAATTEAQVATGSVNHVAGALARLPEQFKNKPNIVALLTALAGVSQPIEDALQQLLTQRALGVAVGAQLDALGVIVGQPRNGLSDSDYTRYLRARIATNRSDGRVEDLIAIAKIVLNDLAITIHATPQGTATFVVRISGDSVPFNIGAIASSFLDAAAAGGVRLLFEAAESNPGFVFTLDAGPGLDVGHLAYAID